jgi:hypothetical protein
VLYDQWVFNPATYQGINRVGVFQNGATFECVGYNFKSWGANEERSYFDNGLQAGALDTDTTPNPLTTKTLIPFPDGSNGLNVAFHALGNRPHNIFIIRGVLPGSQLSLNVQWVVESYADLFGPRAFLYNSARLACPYLYVPQEVYTMDSAGFIGQVIKQYLRKHPHLIKYVADVLSGKGVANNEIWMSEPKQNTVAAQSGLGMMGFDMQRAAMGQQASLLQSLSNRLPFG